MLRLRKFLFWFILFATTSLFAANMPQPLPEEEAFSFTISASSSSGLIAEWHIAPGYYLYRDKLHISLSSPIQGKITQINWPEADVKKDTIGGVYKVYSGTLIVPVMLQNITANEMLKLQVHYQGCSKAGFCYPPIKKTISLSAGSSDNSTPLVNNQDRIAKLMAENHLAVTMLIFLGLGVLLSFTPCVLPMVPILSGIIVGQAKLTARRAFSLSCTYVLGMAITYALAGLAVAWIGSSIQVALQTPWVIGAMSGLFVLLALSLLGMYEIRLPNKIQNYLYGINQRQQGGNYVGVFLMGVLSTLVVSPCVSAPLVGVLAYVAETGNALLGGAALFSLGIGMGIPLLLIGVSAGQWLPKTGPWMNAVKSLFGLVMLGMAIWMLSRLIPAFVTSLLWALLILGSAVYFSLFFPFSKFKLNQIGALVLVIYSLMLMVGVVKESPLLSGANAGVAVANKSLSNFRIVSNTSAFEHELQLAKQANKPILLDFYADWCESCLAMEKEVLSKPDVQKSLASFTLLRVDVTANNSADQALMKQFNVIAPPVNVFFNSNGKELSQARIVGEVDKQEFLSKLTHAINHLQ